MLHTTWKKILFAILALEAVAFAILLYRQCTVNVLSEPIRFSQEELLLERIGVDEEAGFYLDGSFEGEGRSVRTPSISLPRGVYHVRVTYETDFFNEMYEIECTSQAFSIDTASGREETLSPRYILYRHNPDVSYRINVDNECEVTIKNAISDSTGSYLLIRSVEIQQMGRLSVFHYGLRLLLLFAMLDAIAVFLWLFRTVNAVQEAVSKYALEIVGLTALLFISSLPIFMKETLFGHDVHFHMFRIYGIAESIRQGSLLARIQSVWCGDYGYPVGVYYGQLLLYPSALLYLIGFSLDFAYKFYCFFVNVIGVTGSYIAFRKISGNRHYGLAGSTLFSLSTYRLSTLYMRAAAGESAAMAFLPFIIWGLWEIYERKSTEGWIVLSIAASGVIRSHVLSTLIIAMFCLMFVISRWSESIQKAVIISLGKALAATICLSAGQLVPLLDYLLHMDIRESHGAAGFHVDAVDPVQLFANAYDAFGSGIRENIFHEVAKTIGFYSLCVLGVALFMLLKRPNKQPALRNAFWITLIPILAATTVFPWGWIRRALPPVYGLFNHIQFTMRFLLLPTALIALLFVLSLKHLEGWRPEWIAGLAGALCLTACFEAVFFLSSYAGNVYPRDQVLLRDSFSQANGEYLPAGADVYRMREIRVPEVEDPASMQAEIENRNGTSLVARVSNSGDRVAYIDFPMLYYKGYRATDENGVLLPIGSGDMARIRVTIPDSYSGSVHIFFREPLLWRLAEVISLMTVLYVCYLLLLRRQSKAVTRIGNSIKR